MENKRNPWRRVIEAAIMMILIILAVALISNSIESKRNALQKKEPTKGARR